MLSTFRKSPEHLAAAERVAGWVRQRYALRAGEVVMAAEVACAMPGCPPLETVITFWTLPDNERHHLKVFKPIADVVEDDLPPSWYKSALVQDGLGCDCC